MNRELAYKLQMLPQNIRKSRALAAEKLLVSGWPLSVIEKDIDEAMLWANSHCMVKQQEKERRTRAAKKTRLRGDDALDAMFASVGADPTEIPRKV